MKTAVLLLFMLLPTVVFGTVIGWSPTTDSRITGFNLYQSTTSTATKPWTKVNTTTIQTATSLTAAVTTVGTYYWYVTDFDTTTESAPSAVVSLTYTDADFPLAPPAAVNATK